MRSTEDDVRTDGMSRVDVVAFGSASEDCIGIEVKLGTSPAYSRPAEFGRRFVKPVRFSHRSQGKRALAGSVISMLSAGLIAGAGELELEVAPDVWLKPRRGCVLVLRHSVIQRWGTRVPKQLSGKGVEIVSFERLVEDYGGRKPFNELVLKTVGDDPWRSWNLGSSTQVGT